MSCWRSETECHAALQEGGATLCWSKKGITNQDAQWIASALANPAVRSTCIARRIRVGDRFCIHNTNELVSLLYLLSLPGFAQPSAFILWNTFHLYEEGAICWGVVVVFDFEAGVWPRRYVEVAEKCDR